MSQSLSEKSRLLQPLEGFTIQPLQGLWPELFFKRVKSLVGCSSAFSHAKHALDLKVILGGVGTAEHVVAPLTTLPRFLLVCLMDADGKPRAALCSKDHRVFAVCVSVPTNVFEGTVFDGHLDIRNMKFTVCDVLAFNGRSLADEDFLSRLRAARPLQTVQQSQTFTQFDSKEKPLLTLAIKDFYHFAAIPDLLAQQESDCPGDPQITTGNGLIFVPVQRPWARGSHSGLLKMEQDVHINFLVRDLTEDLTPGFSETSLPVNKPCRTLNVRIVGSDRASEREKHNPSLFSIGKLSHKGNDALDRLRCAKPRENCTASAPLLLVDCRWHKSQREWQPVRIRSHEYDRQKPTRLENFNCSMAAISRADEITMAELSAAFSQRC